MVGKKCVEDEEKVNGIKQECEEQLAKAIPALNRAEKAVKDIHKADIDELRA